MLSKIDCCVFISSSRLKPTKYAEENHRGGKQETCYSHQILIKLEASATMQNVKLECGVALVPVPRPLWLSGMKSPLTRIRVETATGWVSSLSWPIQSHDKGWKINLTPFGATTTTTIFLGEEDESSVLLHFEV